MIVGCYTLDLYCDVCWKDTSFPFARRSAFPHTFTGPDRTRATKAARAEGWMVRHSRSNTTSLSLAWCVCPACKKDGHK